MPSYLLLVYIHLNIFHKCLDEDLIQNNFQFQQFVFFNMNFFVLNKNFLHILDNLFHHKQLHHIKHNIKCTCLVSIDNQVLNDNQHHMYDIYLT